MNDQLLEALNDCLIAMAEGAPLGDTLARYPALTYELRSLLEAADAAHKLAEAGLPPRSAQMTSKAQFLARAVELQKPARPASIRAFIERRALAVRALAIGLGLLLGFVLGTYGIVTASGPSLPGDQLYGLKRTVEQAQLFLARDAQSRAQLEQQFTQRRVQEVQSLTTQRRTTPVEFGGKLEKAEGERWSVAGVTVLIAPTTQIIGVPFPGLFAKVTGSTQSDGTVLASRIEVNGIQFVGEVFALGSLHWQIGEMIVFVDDHTNIVGGPQVGDWVEVQAYASADSQWMAVQIKVDSKMGAPTLAAPVATAVVNATPTPSLTPTTIEAETIRFTGAVELMGTDVWQVGGRRVTITSATEIRGDPQVGQIVEVRALQASSAELIAQRVEVVESNSGPSPSNTPQSTLTPSSGSGPSASATPLPTSSSQPTDTSGGSGPSPSNSPQPEQVDFEGTLQAIDGNEWTVAGQTVFVTERTEIRGNPQVGDQVRVRALRQPDGTLLAERIEQR